MTLSRSRPLPSHTWSDPDESGGRHCQTEGCDTTWKAEYDDPPPWGCSGGRTHDWSRDGRYWRCSNTGCTAREFSPDGEPDVDWPCRGGLKRSELENGSGPRPVAAGGRKNREDPETGVQYRYGPFWRFASYRPCVVCGTLDGAPADHWVPVGRGGKDPANCLSLCVHHQDRHDMGEDTWRETYDVDVEEELDRAWREFRKLKPELAEKLEDHLPERRAA